MDVFFFIASIAAIILLILLSILLYYLILFVRDLKYISGKARIEAENLAQDLDDLRQNIRNEGFKFRSFLEFVQNLFKRKRTGTKKK